MELVEQFITHTVIFILMLIVIFVFEKIYEIVKYLTR